MMDENEPEKAELEWGQTPWDNMSRDEMLREIQRMYAALTGLYSVVRMARASDQLRAGLDLESGDPPNPYWGKDGVGGNELEKARQILEPLDEKYDGSTIYRAFFATPTDELIEKRLSCHYLIALELDRHTPLPPFPNIE